DEERRCPSNSSSHVPCLPPGSFRSTNPLVLCAGPRRRCDQAGPPTGAVCSLALFRPTRGPGLFRTCKVLGIPCPNRPPVGALAPHRPLLGPEMQSMNRVRHLGVIATMVVAFCTVGPTVARAETLCFGQPATITGTAGNDVLMGTPGSDVIIGLEG